MFKIIEILRIRKKKNFLSKPNKNNSKKLPVAGIKIRKKVIPLSLNTL